MRNQPARNEFAFGRKKREESQCLRSEGAIITEVNWRIVVELGFGDNWFWRLNKYVN